MVDGHDATVRQDEPVRSVTVAVADHGVEEPQPIRLDRTHLFRGLRPVDEVHGRSAQRVAALVDDPGRDRHRRQVHVEQPVDFVRRHLPVRAALVAEDVGPLHLEDRLDAMAMVEPEGVAHPLAVHAQRPRRERRRRQDLTQADQQRFGTGGISPLTRHPRRLLQPAQRHQ